MKKKLDPEKELLRILSENLSKSIDTEIIDTIMVGVIEDEIRVTNRDRKIESVIDGKEYVEMKKEDHPYYKKKKD